MSHLADHMYIIKNNVTQAMCLNLTLPKIFFREGYFTIGINLESLTHSDHKSRQTFSQFYYSLQTMHLLEAYTS